MHVPLSTVCEIEVSGQLKRITCILARTLPRVNGRALRPPKTGNSTSVSRDDAYKELAAAFVKTTNAVWFRRFTILEVLM